MLGGTEYYNHPNGAQKGTIIGLFNEFIVELVKYRISGLVD